MADHGPGSGMLAHGLRIPAALVLAVLVAGCGAGPRREAPAVATAPAPVCEQLALELVRYANGLRALDAERLGAEREHVEASLAGGWSAAQALRLSLLLTAPAAPLKDEARARALLRDVVTRAGVAEEAEIARFLLAVPDVRQEPEEEGAVVTRRNGALEREMDELRRSLVAERARRAELEEQVEALKELEQNLNQRPNGIR